LSTIEINYNTKGLEVFFLLFLVRLILGNFYNIHQIEVIANNPTNVRIKWVIMNLFVINSLNVIAWFVSLLIYLFISKKIIKMGVLYRFIIILIFIVIGGSTYNILEMMSNLIINNYFIKRNVFWEELVPRVWYMNAVWYSGPSTGSLYIFVIPRVEAPFVEIFSRNNFPVENLISYKIINTGLSGIGEIQGFTVKTYITKVHTLLLGVNKIINPTIIRKPSLINTIINIIINSFKF